MTGLNRATFVGHLGKDPEVRRTNAGTPVVSFSLATSESWRDKRTGERMEKTEWHQIVIFNENLTKIAEQYLSKGSQVLIEGKISTRKWQDKSGQDRYTTEIVLGNFDGRIVLLGKAGDRSGAGGGGGGDGGGGAGDRVSAAGAQSAKSLSEELNDEIPF